MRVGVEVGRGMEELRCIGAGLGTSHGSTGKEPVDKPGTLS